MSLEEQQTSIKISLLQEHALYSLLSECMVFNMENSNLQSWIYNYECMQSIRALLFIWLEKGAC